MKQEALHQNLLNVIKESIPQGTTMANTLCDLLCMGKEAIYRRIRGEVPFSFYEIALISKKFNISLDTIIGTSLPNVAIFHIDKNDYFTPNESHYDSFRNCIKGFNIITSEPFSEIGFSGNSFPNVFMMRFEALLKFYTLRWMYQHKPIDFIHTYDQLVLPPLLSEYHNTYGNTLLKIKKSSYTLSKTVFSNLVNDIKYFQRLSLINDKEIQLIKEELYQILDELEGIAKRGAFDNGNKVQLYISALNYSTNYLFVESPNFYFCSVDIFIMNGLISYDREIFEDIKNLLRTQQRFSTLISETGEAERVIFLKEQRRIIDSL